METSEKPGYHHYIVELEANTEVFRFMLSDISETLSLWRPEPGQICVLEILCLLLDKEKEDYRPKIRFLLREIDIESIEVQVDTWLKDRAYLDQNYKMKLQEFLLERANSIAWLKSLENTDWKAHVKKGDSTPKSAEMVLVDWLAHDYYRIRQILHLKFEFVRFISDLPADYKGEWK